MLSAIKIADTTRVLGFKPSKDIPVGEFRWITVVSLEDHAMLKQAKQLRARQATLPAKLFLGIGGKDSESMTGDLALLEKQLADKPKPFRKLEIASHRFAGRNHTNSLLPGFEAGLKVLFGRVNTK